MIERLLPSLPPLGEDSPFPPGPEGRPLTLSDLQKLAVANSPLVKQAACRVKEAYGNAIQVGLPPNPTFGLEIDTFGTTGGGGYQGGFVDQVIKTANKLQLARASAASDLRAAEFDLFKAQTDLATRVRGGYFAVLVAEESVRLNRALVKFTTDSYQLQVDQVVQAGVGARYEPMYLRSLAIQARAALVQARNRRTSAWKQLAATLGLPGMPPTKLAGRIDIPVPAFEYRKVLAQVLSRHSSFGSAEANVQKAKYDLELAIRTPIPDVEVRAMLQKDRTGAPFEIAGSLAVSVPVPVWNRNQGGILQAQAALSRANELAHQARSDLTTSLADAFERYESNRVLLAYYRDRILPDLVRVFREVYRRWGTDVSINISDIVVAQQNLATALGTYISTLGLLWQAVVDVADPLQTPDLFGIEGPKHAVAEIPDLEKLPGLPCCHPCSPLPNLHHRVLDADWPQADPQSMKTPSSKPQVLPPPKQADKENGEPRKKDDRDDGKKDKSADSAPSRRPADIKFVLPPPPSEGQ
jgi:cobalt-zinc-cadmium efflux system outer membrane protein